MLFNSFEFAVFLPIVFLLYWFVFDYAMRNCRYQLLLQNLLIVVVSYIFYGWWNWRFLLLIAFTTVCSFLSGIGIEKTKNTRWQKTCLWSNIIINLGILGIFKYYDFFVGSLATLLGFDGGGLLLNLILPVGISFYTFQALSYSIDVYQRKLPATHDLIAFAAFLSFFPQLVAGPIERATNLLPQFQQQRTFNFTQASDGMRQILWGLFKKIVVADNCAKYVDTVWGDYANQSGSTLALAAVLFALQIYGDFSGYSDIAIGSAKLFGIQLMRNFNVPYFSRDIAEFWRRWHISLTTWFRDYVYIPLGGSRPIIPEGTHHPKAYKRTIIVRNTFIIFLLSGFWHGANWTFVLWGAYHAFLFIPLILLGKNRRYRNTVAEEHILPTWRETLQILITFSLVVFGWIIFRAPNITAFGEYVNAMFNSSLLTMPYTINPTYILPMPFILMVLLCMEWYNRKRTHGLDIAHWPIAIRWSCYLFVGAFILLFAGDIQTFIYFQF